MKRENHIQAKATHSIPQIFHFLPTPCKKKKKNWYGKQKTEAATMQNRQTTPCMK